MKREAMTTRPMEAWSDDRLPIANLTVGMYYPNATIISVVGFGAYLDIGCSEIDGLLHVRDMVNVDKPVNYVPEAQPPRAPWNGNQRTRKTTFGFQTLKDNKNQAPWSDELTSSSTDFIIPSEIFKPGQNEVGVWVKYLDLKDGKYEEGERKVLALTMKDPNLSVKEGGDGDRDSDSAGGLSLLLSSDDDEEEDTSIDEMLSTSPPTATQVKVNRYEDILSLPVNSELWGQITRITSFGAFLDTGHLLQPFLHFTDHPDFGLNRGERPVVWMKRGERVRVWIKDTDEHKKRVMVTGNRPEGVYEVRSWE
jgi:predicted RNA-binding protein with RPS1 domain